MFPTFLITFREVIEAAIIVSLIIGVLNRTNNQPSTTIVWRAVTTAFAACFFLVVVGSLFGFRMSQLYSQYEEYIEGTLMLLTVFFITWTMFYLHRSFSATQRKLTANMISAIPTPASQGIFVLIFTAVFREGAEVVLFLSAFFLTSPPKSIIIGFVLGAMAGSLFSFFIYRITQKVDLKKIIQVTNFLLLLFAGGLLIRGIHEFTDIGVIPNIGDFRLGFIPAPTTLVGGLLKSIFGLTQNLNFIQIIAYLSYVGFVGRKFISYRQLLARP